MINNFSLYSFQKCTRICSSNLRSEPFFTHFFVVLFVCVLISRDDVELCEAQQYFYLLSIICWVLQGYVFKILTFVVLLTNLISMDFLVPYSKMDCGDNRSVVKLNSSDPVPFWCATHRLLFFNQYTVLASLVYTGCAALSLFKTFSYKTANIYFRLTLKV